MIQFAPLLHAKPCSVRVFPQPCSTGDGRRLDTLFLESVFHYTAWPADCQEKSAAHSAGGGHRCARAMKAFISGNKRVRYARALNQCALQCCGKPARCACKRGAFA